MTLPNWLWNLVRRSAQFVKYRDDWARMCARLTNEVTAQQKANRIKKRKLRAYREDRRRQRLAPTIRVDGVTYEAAQVRLMLERLRGYQAADAAIDRMMENSEEACESRSKRQGRKLAWWEGRFQGLLAAYCMMACGQFPRESVDAIEEALNTKTT
jgi:hypothetical protein